MARSLALPGPASDPHITDLAALGSRVRNQRLQLALRIDDAADACGVASSVLSRLENGGAVNADSLLRILSGLGLALIVTTKDEAIELLSARYPRLWPATPQA